MIGFIDLFCGLWIIILHTSVAIVVVKDDAVCVHQTRLMLLTMLPVILGGFILGITGLHIVLN